MSQVSLFRKWRSKAFADLVGQEAVVKTLRNVLSGGSPARAYLFCGPRGTGKTSTARIFAKALCCENGPALEPCNQCSTCREIAQGNCLDVFEIDAASNTQVDKIRDFIVDKVHFAPAKARYKVYIIDEVHKLSSSSFNALLKTLEEPPSHVVFVLATTHPHELLPTILSRCQRYDFRAFSLREVEDHLNHIAQEERLKLDAEACQLLARAAQGSMRDALVLLEQAHHYSGGDVTPGDVVQMLGLLPQETLGRWVEALRTGQAAILLGAVEEMHRGGQDFVRAVDLWVDHLRLLMLSKVKANEAGLHELNEAYRASLNQQAEGLSMGQILAWLKSAVEVQQAIRDGQPARIALELSLVQLCTPPANSSLGGLEALTRLVQELQEKVKHLGKPAAVAATPPVAPLPVKGAPPPPVQPAPRPRPEPPKPELPNGGKAITSAKEFWPHLQESLRDRDKRLKAFLADAKLSHFGPEVLRISVPATHPVHFEYIGRSVRLLEEVSSQLLQSKVRIEVVQDGAQLVPPQEQEHENLIKKASGLFGGRILDAANDNASE
ncbi:DNA polymerase III subunit gamma/tau [bacterium]|nr:DNA polymerase III subunit gamma/tau [bacterium]